MKDRSLVQVAFYAAVIAVLGLVPSFALPVAGGVPITAQSMGVMLAGVMLGATRGALAVVLLNFIVLLGVPLLAGGRGGLGVLFSPTAGFFLGWIAAAFTAGALMQGLRRYAVFASALIASVMGGIVVLYACGIVGLAINANMTLSQALLASLVFVPGDAIKAVLVALIAQTVARGMPEAMLSRAG